MDFLKIDRSFVRDIEQDDRAFAMVQTILAVANGMRIRAIAEGVENQQQASLLKNAGGEFVQGYHYAKALPLPDFLAYVDQGRSEIGCRRSDRPRPPP